MRHRILAELEKAAAIPTPQTDEFSMELLAHRALQHSRLLGWNLLDLPAQLRISTIDAFCRELALRQPLLSGLGGGLNISEQPDELYRRAARETLRKIDQIGSSLVEAIETLLLWRDNNWKEMEDLLVEMLKSRDRWMHGFLLAGEPDWGALRERLERPFANAVRAALVELSDLLDQVPGAREEALELARFAYTQTGGQLHQELAELVEFPAAPFTTNADFEEARQACICLASLLQTNDGDFRKQVDKRMGFPADKKLGKSRLLDLIARLATVPGLQSALASVRALPPARYTEDDWLIVRCCFTLLRQAVGELRLAFAEAGAMDFTEVAQIAQRVLQGEDGQPTDAALDIADDIRHLLVDEFQDTSRRQHQLLASLIAAWPERPGRTGFVVGDQMQSIYFFRDADAELFPRVKTLGLEVTQVEPLLFDFVPLTANFRTVPALVERINEVFVEIFAANNGSEIIYIPSIPARKPVENAEFAYSLHLQFMPAAGRGPSADPDALKEREVARTEQIGEIIALLGSYRSRLEEAKVSGEKFRIAILGRAKSHLAPIAEALRQVAIPFRAVELESLASRPEVLDALALARALLNPQDRVAWLGVIRAPWCGLSLEELHTIAGDAELHSRPLPELLAERASLLSEAARIAVARVQHALSAAVSLRATQLMASLGSWLEQVWLILGGAACVDANGRANLNLLWSCLDRLPNGEEDLRGPGLDAALDKLNAMPDADSGSDCGVQLMTIHKSKGLEFEVVIVPELQARIRGNAHKMLTWLERGLAEPDDSGEITEFLIAPLQRKGEDRGKAKEWVDRVYRERESQEIRRILYVAATRAREQLHFFARPAFREKDGELTLVEPAESLLATAWPALEEEIRAQFEEWKAGKAVTETHEEEELVSLAASCESNLLVMPSPIRPTQLRRLPPDFRLTGREVFTQDAAESAVLGIGSSPAQLYARHEGGLLSRALGTGVHSLMEELARMRTHLGWEAARAALKRLEPRIAAQVRAAGLDPSQAAHIAAQALELALKASHDPVGAWILSPHAAAASEAGWAGVVAGDLRVVRVDRVFKAGLTPGNESEEAWWIIDYKTAHADNVDPAKSLPKLRELFAPQIEAYAQLLRKQHSAEVTVFAGLYYPRLLLLDWWEL
jgi:ATP-dependent exoDNAse (exonuclease V) beta subunit